MEVKRYKSIEELYLDNRKLVFAYIADYSKEKHIMEDIASTVWVKVWESPKKFLDMDKMGVKQYLRAMVKTAVSDYFRDLERESKIVERMGITLQDDEPWNQEMKKLFVEDMKYYLHEGLKILNEEERQLIVLRFKENRTAREVGSLFNISENNVRVRQMRIIAKMKTHIRMLMNEGSDIDESER